jgi:hypothetical protein
MKESRRWSLELFGFLCILSLAVLFLEQRQACAFDNLHHAHTQLVKAGYCCASDREVGRLQYSFVLSPDALTRTDVVAMRRAGPMGRDWKGRVWIVAPASASAMVTAPGDVPPRVWGAVWAFGDRELLDEIERRRLGRPFFGMLD